ncbi:hypothetical protein [Halobacillus naozhouensis]|uniref:Lipoprotein n=1 Tax=Halobacillus naozhouensis TaxID=554880 RepID=A0ABY8J2G0_9BACI|nr:hypothetical protein [Halobacillus naozhouensis]WFT76678.1 hypothetical protein P9989_10090 [Halobacillus naozhouensis]
MKKLYIPFILIFILLGCSNGEEKPNGEQSTAETLSLEEQITNVMAEKELKNKEIIDYDIKDNFVYVIFKNEHPGNTHNPDLVILKNNNGKIKWVAGPDDRTQSMSLQGAGVMVFGRDKGPSVTILLPDELPKKTNIKGVKVLGESAKAVTYVKELTKDYYKKNMYWIAYTNEEPTHEDFEFIME